MGVGIGDAGSGERAGVAVFTVAGVAVVSLATGEPGDGGVGVQKAAPAVVEAVGVGDTARAGAGDAGEAIGDVAVAAGLGEPPQVRAARLAIAATPERTARRYRKMSLPHS